MTLLGRLAPVVAVSLVGACTPIDRRFADASSEDAGLREGDGSTAADATPTPHEDAAEPDACGAACASACEPACSTSAPVCSSGRCGACEDDAPCAPFPDAPHCLRGACVACASHDHCTDPRAPSCDPTTHTCSPCSPATSGPDEACLHFPGAPVCSHAGACVECTPEKDERCANNVCNAATSACEPSRPKRSKSVCNVCIQGVTPCDSGAPCVSDDECQEGQACVLDKAGAGDAVCMTVATSDALCVRPFFSKSAPLDSVGGRNVVVCTYRTSTTCAAFGSWDKRCGEPVGGNPDASSDVDGSADSAKCGAPDVDDGVCVKYLSQYLCTVPCASEADCPLRSAGCSNQDTCDLTLR